MFLFFYLLVLYFIYLLTWVSIFYIVLLFMCAYNAWVISPPYAYPQHIPPILLPPSPPHPLPSISSRNYFALISNFVEERV
jgi:hypothetical protein